MKYTTGPLIRKFREAAGLKQSDVAKAVGVAPSTYANWEQGTNRPAADQIAPLCSILGVTADELLGLSVQTITKADADLIAAYHAAPIDVQRAVALLLEKYKKGATAGLK